MDNPIVASLYDSRLVRLLSDFNPSGVEVPSRNFADRFGQLVGLSGSIILSMAHEKLQAMEFKPVEVSPEAIKNEFLRVRTSLVRAIAMSFTPIPGRMRDTLPTPDRLHAHFQLTGVYAPKRPGLPKNHSAAFEPYRKMYVTRQKDLAVTIQRLRSHIGNSISGLSPELAQLAKLDASLDSVLSVRTRDLLAAVPRLLERRFGCLLDEHWRELPSEPEASDLKQWMQPGGWISTFCGEMRELLLAELEVRLQPVLGMIDSLPESSIADRTCDEGKNQDRD